MKLINKNINKILYFIFMDITIDLFLVTLLAYFVFKNWRGDLTDILGLFLYLLSITLWIIARIQLGKSFTVLPSATAELKTKGLYKIFRHPIYYFSTLAYLGICLAINHYGYFVFLVIPIILIQIFRLHKEQKKLELKFGSKYLEYKHKTWF